MREACKAIIDKILTGSHGSFAVARPVQFISDDETETEVEGTITFSLSPEEGVWLEKQNPTKGIYVYLSDFTQKPAGWRANMARLWRPKDESQAKKQQERRMEEMRKGRKSILAAAVLLALAIFMTSGLISCSAKHNDGDTTYPTTPTLPPTPTPTNHAPTGNCTASATTGTAPATYTVTCTGSDADGNQLTITIFENGSQIQTGTGNTLSANRTNMAANTYNYYATISDGQASVNTNIVTVIISQPGGNQPPTGTCSASIATGIAPATYTVTCNGQDADGDTLTIRIFENGSQIQSGIGNTLTANRNSMAAGTYSYYASIDDGHSHIVNTNTVTVVISAPNNPPTGTCSASISTGIAPATYTVTCNGSDLDGDQLSITIFENGSPIQSGTGNTLTANRNSMAAGTYSYYATINDGHGHTVNTNTVTVTINTPNNNPPTGTCSASISTGIAPATYTVTCNGQDADGDTLTITVFESVNGGAANAIQTGTGNTLTTNRNSMAAGTYSYYATINDGHNPAVTTNVVTVIVFPQPTIVIIQPVDNANFTAPANVTVVAIAMAAPGDTINFVEFRSNGAVFAVLPAGGSYSALLPNLTAGSYTLTARVVTLSGGDVTSAPVTIIVTALPTNNPPSVSITSPNNGDEFIAGSDIQFCATATDPDPGDHVVSVEFYSGSQLIGTATSSPFCVTWPNVPQGVYAIIARGIDTLGATGSSNPIAISVTPLVANVPPTVVITEPLDWSVYTGPTSLTVKATITDSDGTIQYGDLFIDDGFVNRVNSAPYNWFLPYVSVGMHTIRVVGVDDDGAASSASITIFVDNPPSNQPPIISILSPWDGAIIPDGPTNINVSTDPWDFDGWIFKVEAYLDGSLVGTVFAWPWNVLLTNVSVGSHTLTVIAYDDDGAPSAPATINFTVTRANHAPVVDPANFTVSTNVPFSCTLTGSDPDGDPITFHLVSGSGPSHGTLLLNPDGTCTYTSFHNYVGPDQFQVYASDGLLNSANTTITIDVVANPTLRIVSTFDPANFPAGFTKWTAYGIGFAEPVDPSHSFPEMAHGTTMFAEFRGGVNADAFGRGYFEMAINFEPTIHPDVYPAASINWLPFGIGATCGPSGCTGGTYYSGLPLTGFPHNGITGIHFYYNPYDSDPANDVELTNWALLPNNQGGANFVIAFSGGQLPPGTVATVTVGIPVDSDNDGYTDNIDMYPFDPTRH